MTTPTPTTRAEDDLVTAEQAIAIAKTYRFHSNNEARNIGMLADTVIALHEALAAERALRVAAEARVAVLEGERNAARVALADMANTINIVGSDYDKAINAIDGMVSFVKKRARAALESGK